METAPDNPAPDVTPGQVLAEARERQGLSRTEIAQRLHMSPSQIEALETGEYERLPKGPFLRGFIRNYAKLLGIEAEPLVASLAQATPAHQAAPRIVVPSQNIRFEPLHERISSSPYVKGGVIALVVLCFGLAAMYWWVAMRPGAAPPPAAKKVEPAPQGQIAQAPLPAVETPPPVPAPQEAAQPETTKADAPKAAAPRADAPKPDAPKTDVAKKEAPKGDASKAEASKADATKTATTPVSNTTTVGSGPGRLAFRFRGDAWVEVKDANGKVLLSKLNEAGSELRVAGKPPLTVIVGNAPDVSVLYNDREFPLEPHTKVAVARFTVE